MNAMIERLTLEELAQTLVQQSEVKQDYLVDSTRMVMEAYGGTPVLRVLDYSGGDCMEPLELTSTAHKQLGAYLRIPASYYDRMLREATDLLTTNVNNWLNRTAEVKLLRTMDGAARAVLSNRYWCVDHLNLLQMVIPVLGHMPGINVLDCGLSETRMYVKVTSERLKEDVIPGDTVQYGFIITNSEVGMGASKSKTLPIYCRFTARLLPSSSGGSNSSRNYGLSRGYSRIGSCSTCGQPPPASIMGRRLMSMMYRRSCTMLFYAVIFCCAFT